MITLALAWVLAGGAVASVSPAEKLNISGTIAAGTGQSMAAARRKTMIARSPAFLSFEVGFRHPQVDWLEFAPQILLEVERRTGFAVNPRLRAFLPQPTKVRVYGVLGLPIFIAPYSLLGVEASAGLLIPLHKHFGFTTEIKVAAYFWGSDLMPDSTIVKIDGAFGVRAQF